jgi:hypothetical protein
MVDLTKEHPFIEFSELLERAHDVIGSTSPTMGSIAKQAQEIEPDQPGKYRKIVADLAMHWMSDLVMLRIAFARGATEDRLGVVKAQMLGAEVYSKLVEFLAKRR